MSPELDLMLCDRYPLLFAERHAPKSQTTMLRGFECEDGWYCLIDVLCHQLQNETECGEAPQAVAMQVKEKLGSLRFYVRGYKHGVSEKQWAMIKFAQALSLRICEICGAPTPHMNDTETRLATRCDAHFTP